MKFVHNTTWQEVFEGWRRRESNNPEWIECATRIKGWPDWESWRSFTAEQLNAKNRDWKIYKFENPIEEIPNMLMGPYSGWQSGVINKNESTFQDLLEIPSQYEQWCQHSGVLSIMKGLPFETEFIGLIRKDVDKIVCLDGHHRATAIALAKKQNIKIDFSKIEVTIALTEWASEDYQLLEEILQRGTSRKM